MPRIVFRNPVTGEWESIEASARIVFQNPVTGEWESIEASDQKSLEQRFRDVSEEIIYASRMRNGLLSTPQQKAEHERWKNSEREQQISYEASMIGYYTPKSNVRCATSKEQPEDKIHIDYGAFRLSIVMIILIIIVILWIWLTR